MPELTKEQERTLLTEITFVICTYGRPEYVLETVSFLRTSGLKAIVVDGSDEPNHKLSSLNVMGFRYVYRPRQTYQERMAIAAGLIETQYTMSMSDDEYFVPSTVAAAVEFMMSNPDYSACTGEAIGFSSDSGKLMIGVAYPELRGFSLEMEDPQNRMRKHLSSYRVASYYSVVRTPVWQHCWTEISKKSYLPYGVSELQFEAALSYAGKFKVLPVLMWWRNELVTPVRVLGDPDDAEHLQFSKWWRSSKNLEEKKDFIDQMAEILNGLSLVEGMNHLTKHVAKREVQKAFHANALSNSLPLALQHGKNLFHEIFRTRFRKQKMRKVYRDYNSTLALFGAETTADEAWFSLIVSRIKSAYLS